MNVSREIIGTVWGYYERKLLENSETNEVTSQCGQPVWIGLGQKRGVELEKRGGLGPDV